MRKTGDVLIELGITPELKGFQYIIDMMKEMQKDSGCEITALYEIVGRKNNTTASKVERTIRHAIKGRIDIDSDEYKRYIGLRENFITNSSFINTLKYKLENMED